MGVGLKIENILERHLNGYKPVKAPSPILFPPNRPRQHRQKRRFLPYDHEQDQNSEGSPVIYQSVTIK